MKSREYYELKNQERINKIKKDNEKSMSPEIVKYFVGNEDESKSALLKRIVENTNILKIKEELERVKLFIEPMYIDLIKEFYELSKENINNIDKEWLVEFKVLAKDIIWSIPSEQRLKYLEKGVIKESYEFHLNQSRLIGIQL